MECVECRGVGSVDPDCGGDELNSGQRVLHPTQMRDRKRRPNHVAKQARYVTVLMPFLGGTDASRRVRLTLAQPSSFSLHPPTLLYRTPDFVNSIYTYYGTWTNCH